MRSVAVVGVGEMGAPVATRLIGAGFDVTVCDTSHSSLEPFAATAVRLTRRPADCARADAVLVLVNTAAQVREVIAGRSGLVAGMDPSRGPIVVVMSTVAASVIRELDEAVRGHGGRLVDAPVSGGEARALEGSLTIMMGGHSEDVESVAPVLSHIGTHVFHCGPIGAGENVKVLNNAIGTLNALIGAEVARIAIQAGVEVGQLADVLEVSTGRNFLSANRSALFAHYERYGGTQTIFESALALYKKDAELAAELAWSVSGEFPVIEALLQLTSEPGAILYDSWHAVAQAAAGDGSGSRTGGSRKTPD